MDCKRVSEKLSAYVDGALDQQTLELVDRHIASCTACARELASMRTLVRAASEIEHVDPPSDLRARIAAAIFAQEQDSQALPRRPVQWRAWLHALRPVAALKLAGGAVAVGAVLSALVITMPRSPEPAAPTARKSVPGTPAAVSIVPPAPAAAAVERSDSGRTKPVVTRSASVRRHIPQRTSGREPVHVAVNPVKPAAMPIEKPADERSVPADDTEKDADTNTEQVAEVSPNSVEIDANSEPTVRPQSEPKKPGEPALARVAAANVFAEDAEQWVKRMKEEAALRKRSAPAGGIPIIAARF